MVFAVPASKNQAKRSFTHKTSTDHQISVCWTSYKTLYQKDISRCLPTARSSSWSWRRGSRGRPRSWGSSWGGSARRGRRRTGARSGRGRGAPRTDLGAGTRRPRLLQRSITEKSLIENILKDCSFDNIFIEIYWQGLNMNFQFPSQVERIKLYISRHSNVSGADLFENWEEGPLNNLEAWGSQFLWEQTNFKDKLLLYFEACFFWEKSFVLYWY